MESGSKRKHWRSFFLGAALAVVTLPFVVYHGGWARETAVVCVLFLVLLLLTVTDVTSMLMPNCIVYPGLFAVLILRLLIHQEPWWTHLAGFLVGGAVLTAIAMVSNGMGGGDIKVFAMIGLALGVEGVLFAILYSCMWGTLIGILLRGSGRIKARQQIPFGPFILLGTMTSWAYGNEVWRWYCERWT
jgi:leader peptidase (prepilin peptidase)/N-methyltransferase